jgi:orotate phosphoribosyltransferase
MSKLDKLRMNILEYAFEIGTIDIRNDALITLASGQRSPVYCYWKDFALTNKGGRLLEKAFNELWKGGLKDKFEDRPTHSFGVPMGAVIPAYQFAQGCGLETLVLRPEPKDHGGDKGSKLLGLVSCGSHKVVIIEDTVTSGGSAVAAQGEVHSLGHKAIGLVTIFCYDPEKMKTLFQTVGGTFVFESLLSLDDIKNFLRTKTDDPEYSKYMSLLDFTFKID